MGRVDLSINNSASAQQVLGKVGHEHARKATWAALRKAVVEVEQYHKRMEMLPGGGKKAFREPDPVRLRVRTGALKREYTRRLFQAELEAHYGSDLIYAPVHEFGSPGQNLRPRPGVQRSSDAISPRIDKWIVEALAKEGL